MCKPTRGNNSFSFVCFDLPKTTTYWCKNRLTALYVVPYILACLTAEIVAKLNYTQDLARSASPFGSSWCVLCCGHAVRVCFSAWFLLATWCLVMVMAIGLPNKLVTSSQLVKAGIKMRNSRAVFVRLSSMSYLVFVSPPQDSLIHFSEGISASPSFPAGSHVSLFPAKLSKKRGWQRVSARSLIHK